MADEWARFRLGELVAIKHGFAFSGQHFLDEETEDVVLTPGNFAIGGGFQSKNYKYYRGPVPDGYVLREGDLLITMTDLSRNADTLGYPAIVPAHPRLRFLHNQRLGLVEIADDQLLDKCFLYYRLCATDYRHHVVSTASGTTVKHTSPARICQFTLPLPPLPEQRAIAGILGALDDKIELNQRMNEALDAIAHAIFKSWFVDFDPARAKVAGRDPALPKHLSDLFPDRLVPSELGEIPERWKVATIGELADVVGGSTPSTKEAAYWDGGIHRWATPKDLSRLSVPVLLETERKITDSGLAQISSGLLPAGTALLSSRAPIGYLAIAEVPVAINQGFIAMTPKKGMSNLFLLLWTSFAQDDILSRANGSTFQEISKASFRPIPLVAPPAGVMQAFDERVRPLYRRIVENERESRTLAALRDALLPKLLSGQIRVKGAEKLGGDAV